MDILQGIVPLISMKHYSTDCVYMQCVRVLCIDAAVLVSHLSEQQDVREPSQQ